MATGYSVIGGSVTVVVNEFTAEFTVDSSGGAFANNTFFHIAVENGSVLEAFGNNVDYQDAGGGVWDIFTIDVGVSSFTFRISWPSVGTKSIVYTNDSGFSNPSNGSVDVINPSSMNSGLCRRW